MSDKNFFEEIAEALAGGLSKALWLVFIIALLLGIGIGFLIKLLINLLN